MFLQILWMASAFHEYHKAEDMRLAFTQEERLAAASYCTDTEFQKPNPLKDPNTFDSNATAGVRKNIVGGSLNFCHMVNYQALLPVNMDPQTADLKAQAFYDKTVQLLQRYDCRDFYPYRTCDRCKTNYRVWVCGVMFPMACNNDFGGIVEARKMCNDVCYEVVRKCPVELDFHCPTDDSTYASPSVSNGLLSCNPMNLTINGATGSSVYPGVLVSAMSALVAMLFFA